MAKIRRPIPVGEYLYPQRRFAHLLKSGGDAETLTRLQAVADCNIRRHGLTGEEDLDEDARVRVFLTPENPEGRYEYILHATS